jgi:hypothetical protein
MRTARVFIAVFVLAALAGTIYFASSRPQAASASREGRPLPVLQRQPAIEAAMVGKVSALSADELFNHGYVGVVPDRMAGMNTGKDIIAVTYPAPLAGLRLDVKAQDANGRPVMLGAKPSSSRTVRKVRGTAKMYGPSFHVTHPSGRVATVDVTVHWNGTTATRRFRAE